MGADESFFAQLGRGISGIGEGLVDSFKQAVPVFTKQLLEDRNKNPDRAVVLRETPQQPIPSNVSTNPAPGSIVINTQILMLVGAGLLLGFVLMKKD